jgi:probable DNA metabolism protein
MHRVLVEPLFTAWREAARECLREGWLPEQIDLQDVTEAQTLELIPAAEDQPQGDAVTMPFVPKSFLQKAEMAGAHRDPQRWNLLYRILFRLQANRDLLRDELDDDVARMLRFGSQVARDLHKMHAFVRFRKVEEPGPDSVREHYIAWYKPEYRVLRLAAPFFAERFAVMQWTILTPDESVAWDPEAKEPRFGPGVGRDAAPPEDELEGLWRTYYGSIFNPARLNTSAMRSEMPVRYWQTLPEIAILPQLMQRAEGRVTEMMKTQKETVSAAPFVPAEHVLPVLRAAMPSCQGCELYKHATQVVPGIGGAHAKLFMVGEQPGDQEDLQGKPFVGPAGKVLRRALEELEIEAKEVFTTNAVKHFKFVQRGKLRLHQNPRMGEINACRPWLLGELDAVKPKVVLCLGASAAKSLMGSTFTLTRERGQFKSTPYAERVMATFHPSAILRAPDDVAREGMYRMMKDDIATAYQAALHGA